MKGQMLSWNIRFFPGRRQLRKSSLNSKNIPGDLLTHFRWRGNNLTSKFFFDHVIFENFRLARMQQ